MAERDVDIAVIGGGAAALAFAAMCGGRRVTLLERAPRVGKKLLSTGNGKCNLTGLAVSAEDFNDPGFAGSFLARFSPEKAVSFFGSLGLRTRVTGGRVYPYSESASSVLDALLCAARDRGADILTRREVRAVTKAKDGFLLDVAVLGEKGETVGSERVSASAVVLATGSDAAQGRDSTALFTALGHTARKFAPSLVPLKTDRESVKGLNGVRVKCAAELCGMREEGEILFRDYGLSGIAALNISAMYARGVAKRGDVVTLDLMPECTASETEAYIAAQRGRSAERVLKGLFHSRVAERVAERAGQHLGEAPDAAALARVIKRYTLVLQGTCDASQAQVMSGGLTVREFDDGLCSVIVPGAYAVGEALDVDGLCGGCNLQWAWASAHAAAHALSQA